eukprot:3353530-Ditylum_brightwellii.AAC.1
MSKFWTLWRQTEAALRTYVKTIKGQGNTLNILWWEWPEEHRNKIQNDILINFIGYPTPCLTPNPDILEDQMDVATKL